MLKNGVYHIGGQSITVNDHTSDKAKEAILKKYPKLDDYSRKKSESDNKGTTKSKKGKSSGSSND